MAQEKMQMPSGMGGLVRYFDEYKSRIEFGPGTVIFFIVLVIVIMFLLHTYGNGIFGV
jgi:preprotein translocase subunit Sec61beta